MGPYSEERQYQRASAIAGLLDRNPDLSEEMKTIWKRHLLNLSFSESTYNYRVKHTFFNKQRKEQPWEQ